MNYTATLTQKGQMTLPAPLRAKLGVKNGEKVKLSLQGKKVIIEKDDYWQQLAASRAEAQKYLKANGLHGLSIDEIKRRTDQARQSGER